MSSSGHDEIVEVVRRSFASGSQEGLAENLTGPLADYAGLYDGLPGLLRPFLSRAEIRELKVSSVDGDVALCDCDIVAIDEYARKSGLHVRAVGRINAPLVLERTRGEWRVADYALNGRRLLRSVRFYDAGFAAHADELLIQPRAVELARYGTILIVDVGNEGAVAVRLEQAMMLGKGRIGPWLRERNFARFAGETRINAGSPGRVAVLIDEPWPLTARTVTVDLRFVRAGGGDAIRARLALPFADRPEPAPQRLASSYP